MCSTNERDKMLRNSTNSVLAWLWKECYFLWGKCNISLSSGSHVITWKSASIAPASLLVGSIPATSLELQKVTDLLQAFFPPTQGLFHDSDQFLGMHVCGLESPDANYFCTKYCYSVCEEMKASPKEGLGRDFTSFLGFFLVISKANWCCKGS